MGAGDSSLVDTWPGRIVSWMLVLFGVAIVAAITGALVGFLIEYLLKEGMGMGAAGFRDHIVVCGWNSTARELVTELEGDEFTTKVVVIHDVDKNPAGEGVYFVSGDITRARRTFRRAGIRDAMAALIFPADPTDEADMQLDPVHHGDRVGRPACPDRRRGQQPGARGALPARGGRRDRGQLTARLPADGEVLALPGPGGWSPTSSRVARGPSSTASRCPTTTSG